MADRSFRSTTCRPGFADWRLEMRLSTIKTCALAALAAALMAIATPATAQGWEATPRPAEVQGTSTCLMRLNHPDFAIIIMIDDETSKLYMQSRYFVGVAQETIDSVITFPDGFQSRMELNKIEENLATFDISSESDLYIMIDRFVASGDFSVVVLGGRPTAFRLPEVPAAEHAIPTMKDCVEEFYYG